MIVRCGFSGKQQVRLSTGIEWFYQEDIGAICINRIDACSIAV
jgi:hypothetical protein